MPLAVELGTELDSLHFDNRFVRELPCEADHGNHTRQVLEACSSRVTPTPVRAPRVLAVSREMASELGLGYEACFSQRFADVFAGNATLPFMAPFAACYGGHQFGSWAGQLGDGRAITLGEVVAPSGSRWELQLKGAGPTPYSRRSDGRAVLRSSLREFLCSEAMAHLGVPTTRALSLISTGEEVERDMFYDGRPKLEPGAIVCRAAPTFIRFGNFELFASRGDRERLQALTDFTLRHYFAELGAPSPSTYLALLGEVAERTASLIVEWLRVGFVHGVMNTDNMSVVGLTIDYGPYGWLDNYDPRFTPNTTDASGRRYCFANQPGVGLFNVVQLANALSLLVPDKAGLEQAVERYQRRLALAYSDMMARKLGLAELELSAGKGRDEATVDDQLLDALLELFAKVETDVTIFYRLLARLSLDGLTRPLEEVQLGAWLAQLQDAFYPEDLSLEQQHVATNWLRLYVARCASDKSSDEVRRQRMDAANPAIIPRNFLAQQAIDAAEAGDTSVLEELLEALRHPYELGPLQSRYFQKRPEWAKSKPGCSMLSCSS